MELLGDTLQEPELMPILKVSLVGDEHNESSVGLNISVITKRLFEDKS